MDSFPRRDISEIMAPLSNSSKNMKVILAVVVLFLGYHRLMIPRNEAPWDKTSSSFLVRRP